MAEPRHVIAPAEIGSDPAGTTPAEEVVALAHVYPAPVGAFPGYAGGVEQVVATGEVGGDGGRPDGDDVAIRRAGETEPRSLEEEEGGALDPGPLPRPGRFAGHSDGRAAEVDRDLLPGRVDCGVIEKNPELVNAAGAAVDQLAGVAREDDHDDVVAVVAPHAHH